MKIRIYALVSSFLLVSACSTTSQVQQDADTKSARTESSQKEEEEKAKEVIYRSFWRPNLPEELTALLKENPTPSDLKKHIEEQGIKTENTLIDKTEDLVTYEFLPLGSSVFQISNKLYYKSSTGEFWVSIYNPFLGIRFYGPGKINFDAEVNIGEQSD
ncbi:hypothetical protein [Pelagicoccus mobilis]|uniref:Lipoprotein n=1 Tax=Pelagicoccus mobilis TaxID=415221 RepID=A0A934S7A2_9BACT|nr:hypothetical protein [Pelagicoccus mobilis]MBK1880659.1 hypothetical protein [Pelagicoccus mobilis]